MLKKMYTMEIFGGFLPIHYSHKKYISFTQHLRFSFPEKVNLFSLKVPSGSERHENGNGLPGALSLMNMEPHCAREKAPPQC
jgi:hypothetical protein